MTGVTHSRALGREDAEQFAAFEAPRRQGKMLAGRLLRFRQLCDHRAIYQRALLRETRPQKRSEYETELKSIVTELLRLEVELGL